MNRRQFVQQSGSAALAACSISPAALIAADRDEVSLDEVTQFGPTASLIPIVGDGKWINKAPPKDAKGLFEPRSFDVSIGMEFLGTGRTTNIQATTPIPVDQSEQKVEDWKVKTSGPIQARPMKLHDTAGLLYIAAGQLAKGQVLKASVEMNLTIHKQYHGYEKQQFPSQQEPPKEITRAYLQNSPGIQTKSKEVGILAEKLIAGKGHPWDRTQQFVRWIRRNIRGRYGSYTSVTKALQDRVGDCEEMSAVLVALCRHVGIPARLVWVPNHNWSEVYLVDNDGQGHWLPVHTSCYSWFGWTGAHELVIQKGDRIRHPQKRKFVRLLGDWLRWSGSKPVTRFTATMKPVATKTNSDPGPGARTKDQRGEWKVVGTHPMNRYMRR